MSVVDTVTPIVTVVKVVVPGWSTVVAGSGAAGGARSVDGGGTGVSKVLGAIVNVVCAGGTGSALGISGDASGVGPSCGDCPRGRGYRTPHCRFPSEPPKGGCREPGGPAAPPLPGNCLGDKGAASVPQNNENTSNFCMTRGDMTGMTGMIVCRVAHDPW